MELKEIRKKIEEEKQEQFVKDDIMLLSDVAKEKEKTFDFKRYSTGIAIMDDVMKLHPHNKNEKGGFAGGDVVIVSAPTGNGKTTLAATISKQLMEKEGLPSVWFTYEVNAFNLWQVFKEMGTNEEELFCVPLEHTTGKLEWIEKKIVEAKEKYFAKVAVIDHLGFLAPFQKMNESMTQNYSAYLSQVVRELKTIAVKENIIIILPAHMVKSATGDPTLRDIGHSGGIAQEADVVILMAREENPKTRVGVTMENYYSPYTKVILAKNRIGGETPSWWMERKNGRLIETYKEKSDGEKYI